MQCSMMVNRSNHQQEHCVILVWFYTVCARWVFLSRNIVIIIISYIACKFVILVCILSSNAKNEESPSSCFFCFFYVSDTNTCLYKHTEYLSLASTSLETITFKKAVKTPSKWELCTHKTTSFVQYSVFSSFFNNFLFQLLLLFILHPHHFFIC